MEDQVVDDLQAVEQVHPSISSYTVDALLEKLGVTANIQVWKSIDTIIYVQGVVSKVKTYGRVVYFDLMGGNTKLSVKCPADIRPQEGDHIIVEGLPVLKPSRFNTGLDVVIEGKPVASVEPPKLDDNPVINLKKDSFLRLHDCLADQWLDNFCLAGTETAIRDVVSQLQPEIREQIRTRVIRVSEKTALLSDLRNAIEASAAFAIVRGGDDASLSVWNDPEVISELLKLNTPFYVALGHTHFVSLTTQYADESFHTPTDFGIAINTITRRLLNEHHLLKEVDTLKIHQVSLDKDMAVLREKENNSNEKLQLLSHDLHSAKQTIMLYKQRNNTALLVIFILAAILAMIIWY